MAKHRLPGMSISGELWAALTELANATGTTRTDLIRHAIARLIDEEGPLADDLADAQRQLDAIKATLARHTTVAA